MAHDLMSTKQIWRQLASKSQSDLRIFSGFGRRGCSWQIAWASAILLTAARGPSAADALVTAGVIRMKGLRLENTHLLYLYVDAAQR